MRAAVIGGGFAGRVHVQALRSIGVEPYLVITSKEETAKRFAEEMGIPNFSGADKDGYAAVFAPEIDAVHVCTPPTSHAAIVKELLRHGKNVLCEKPVALDLEEARDLVNAVSAGKPGSGAESEDGSGYGKERSSGCEHENSSVCGPHPLCALTFNVRFHMACQRAKELIESGTFGKPILIHGNYMQEFHALPAPPDWRYDPATGGKMRAISEIGSHWIDLAQYLSGKKVTAVSAQTANFWPERELRDGLMIKPEAKEASESEEALNRIHVVSEDAATVNLRFEDGAIGGVVLSEVSPGRGNRLTLEITCENGNLWWNEEENNILHTAKKGEGIRSEVFAFGNGFGDTFEELLRRFYVEVERRSQDRLEKTTVKEASAEGTAPAAAGLPTFEEGLQVAAVCCAIKESAEKDGKWIAVL